MKPIFLSAALAATLALPAFAADGIAIEDAYARSSTAMSQSGAAFMRIVNDSDTDQRIIAARSDAAQRVELHTHIEDAQGVMRMVEVEEGFLIPAQGAHDLARGGDHLMFLGIETPFEQGMDLTVTLVFEDGVEMDITVPVDLERMDMHGHSHGHSHGHRH